ncbi:ATP-binding protein [Acidisoma cellulosilytica]|uniref:ATP-binding protein n=1 Tax=Acidisoma cellulosilyticum TaxID=2802395 RepID=A0A963Z5I9_9PROT|nr:ATP-binding protein [Acidisoma cellulosilyticum]MCB8883285.1 ATP-binding protein [Acidisoma cellulosilyticum]
MSDSSMIAPLKVANEAFLVSSMIERCPKTMMIRELVVNGLEAAAGAAPGQRQVVIGPRQHEGARKLRIWNTGPGLNAAELLQITDLASSLRKQNSLDQNFGMGAKVASLPSNRHGLRYRSCVDGRVSEVVMGYRDGTYGRLRVGPDRAEVIDATQACLAEGDYDLSIDWTEVLLGGNSADQDTVASPYGPSLKSAPDWMGAYLENRFFRLPHDVSLTLMPAIWGGAAPRAMVGLDDRQGEFGRTETRTTPSGVKIHYFYDPPEGESTQSAKGAIATSSSRGAVVFRDEMYDVRAGDGWLQDAPNFGVPFGAKYVSVFVELPHDYLVWPEAYRQFLRFRGNDQRQVHIADFSALVRSYMPAWLAEIIRSFGPGQANYLDDISDELKALLADLKVPLTPQAPVPGAPVPPKPPEAAKPPAPLPPVADDKPKPPPAPPKPPAPPSFERPPEIIGLRTPEQIKERALEGRAAKFYPQSHQIFINLSYPAVTDMAATLLSESMLQASPQEEEGRRIATETAEWALTKRITRAVVYSMSKKGLGWRPEEVSRSQSTESLSLVADDWAGALEMARTRFQDRVAAEIPNAMPHSAAA